MARFQKRAQTAPAPAPVHHPHAAHTATIQLAGFPITVDMDDVLRIESAGTWIVRGSFGYNAPMIVLDREVANGGPITLGSFILGKSPEVYVSHVNKGKSFLYTKANLQVDPKSAVKG